MKHAVPHHTRFHVACTVSGSPRGLKLNNTWTGAVAMSAVPSSAVELFAEVMGVTAASPEGEGGDYRHLATFRRDHSSSG